MDDASRYTSGRYRRWDGVSLRSGVLVSTRPLAATRLNDVAAEILEELAEGTFRTPEAVAAATGHDPETVATLLERLHRRGFLEWAPARDDAHRPPVSVVVTVRDDREQLRTCLAALAALDYPTYEVVVVDDGSTDGTVEMATSHPLADDGRLTLVSVGSAADPLGIGAARNRGVAAANHDVIAFTDADCRPRPAWLADLVPTLAAHDLVGGRIRPAGNTPADVYEGVNSSLDMGAHAARVDPDGATPYLPTANLVGRREVFEAIPFPERSVAEDVDVCWRALEAGYDVVYAATGVVEHDYRTGVRSFAARRADYGGSEALLARTYDNGDAVSLPLEAVCCLVLLAVGLALTSTPFLLAAGAIGGLLAGVAALGFVRQSRRLGPVAGPGLVLRSRLRSALSTTYALSKEVTRYYAVALAFVALVLVALGAFGDARAFGAGGNGAPTLGVALLGLVIGAVTLPAAVEYAVHRPAVSPLRYAQYYLADHLGYQRGVYRGALRHRTLAHLSPRARFQSTGPTAALLAAVADRLVPETDARSVSVGGVTAEFRATTSAETWWFDDDALRGERPVLTDVLERVRPDDVVLDVGANVGLYSCLVGRRLVDGTVVAVEPHPANAARLEANLEANGVDATVVRRALGRREATGRLRVAGSASGTGEHALVNGAERADGGRSRSPSDSDAGTDETMPVAVTSGDALVSSGDAPQPTVVKIDVEGAELDVLAGLRGTLSEPACRLVVCEVHPAALEDRHGPGSEAEIRRLLADRGFALETVHAMEDGRYVLGARRSGSKRAEASP